MKLNLGNTHRVPKQAGEMGPAFNWLYNRKSEGTFIKPSAQSNEVGAMAMQMC